MTNRIQVKETKQFYWEFEGSLVDIISKLQSALDEGWEGIDMEYGYDDYQEYYLYKHRPETDKEYAKRMKEREKKKAAELKAKERRRKEYEKLKKNLRTLEELAHRGFHHPLFRRIITSYTKIPDDDEQILKLAETCEFENWTRDKGECWECLEEQLLKFAQEIRKQTIDEILTTLEEVPNPEANRTAINRIRSI